MKSFILILLFVTVSSFVSAQQLAAPKNEFSVALSENELTIPAGESRDVTLLVARSKPYRKWKAVNGTLSALPQGISVVYDNADPLAQQYDAHIVVSGTVKPGIYRIVLHSTINFKTKGATLKLVVNPGPGSSVISAN